MYDLAQANLRLSLDVVAGTVNPVAATREAWRSVANTIGAGYVDVDVVCSVASIDAGWRTEPAI